MITNKKERFNVGDFIVYPNYGIGTIIGEENHNKIDCHMYVIYFQHDDVILKIPKFKVTSSIPRCIVNSKKIKYILNTLVRKKIKLAACIWSKKLLEYESKIDLGCITSMVKIVVELYFSANKLYLSYNEKNLFEGIIQKIAKEYSIISRKNLTLSVNIILHALYCQ